MGFTLMAAITLMQVGGEFAMRRDSGRLFAKLCALSVALPVIALGSAALFDRLVRRRGGLSPVRHLLGGAVAAGVFCGLLLLGVRRLSFEFAWLRPDAGVWDALELLRLGFTMGTTAFALWALAFLLPLAAENGRLRELEAEKLRSQAELSRLRSQLEPHFLRNGLNTVASILVDEPDEARRLLASLGHLLNDSLAAGRDRESLGEQIEWLKRYAHIAEVRHAGRLEFTWDIDESARLLSLPSLLLQPLLENALNHGALRRRGGGAVTIRAHATAQWLTCSVEDNGPGVPPGPVREGAFGLESVRRRLLLIYQDAAKFRLESSDCGTRSIVEIPLTGAAS